MNTHRQTYWLLVYVPGVLSSQSQITYLVGTSLTGLPHTSSEELLTPLHTANQTMVHCDLDPSPTYLCIARAQQKLYQGRHLKTFEAELNKTNNNAHLGMLLASECTNLELFPQHIGAYSFLSLHEPPKTGSAAHCKATFCVLTKDILTLEFIKKNLSPLHKKKKNKTRNKSFFFKLMTPHASQTEAAWSSPPRTHSFLTPTTNHLVFSSTESTILLL